MVVPKCARCRKRTARAFELALGSDGRNMTEISIVDLEDIESSYAVSKRRHGAGSSRVRALRQPVTAAPTYDLREIVCGTVY